MIKDIILPSLGEGITEGTVISVLVQKGDEVSLQQGIIEVETDKVALEVPVEDEGIIEEIFVEEGTAIKVGECIATLKVSLDTNKTAVTSPTVHKVDNTPLKNKATDTTILEKETTSNTFIATKTSTNRFFRASPLARKLARELGVAIDTIKYDGGRVRVKDVKNFVKNKLTTPLKNKPLVKPLPDFSKWGAVDRKKLSPMGNAVLKNMEYSWATIPHAWIHESVDITRIEASRQKHKAQVKKAGASLTITSLLVKVCAIALKEHPIFNSSLDSFTKKIIYKKYYNIGIAVDTERGLLVPVLKNADKKNLLEISQNLTQLSQDALLKKTSIEDLEGATFTISNLGGIGSTGIMPIINAPEVAILGVGASKMEPKWDGTKFKPCLIAPLTIAFDHRVINGADALRFLRTIKELLEKSFTINLSST